MGGREIVCLHSLQSSSAARLSMPVIRGVGYTSVYIYIIYIYMCV